MQATKTTAASAASLIRAELKKNGIKATVRSENYAGGSSIRIGVIDLLPATLREIESFAHGFQYGNFNGMTDSYEYSNNRDDIPQVSYVFVNCTYSEEVRQAAWDFLRAGFAGFGEAPASVTAANDFYCADSNSWGGAILHRVLSETCGYKGFWNSYKPRVRAA